MSEQLHFLPERFLTPQQLSEGAQAAYQLYRKVDPSLPNWAMLPAENRRKFEFTFEAFARKGPGPNVPTDKYEQCCREIVIRTLEATKASAQALAVVPPTPPQPEPPASAENSGGQQAGSDSEGEEPPTTPTQE